MNHHDMELELQHLEYIFARISAADAMPPLSYWRGRLDSLRQRPIVPPQRDRLDRLERLLGSLESPPPESAKPAAPKPPQARESALRAAGRMRR